MLAAETTPLVRLNVPLTRSLSAQLDALAKKRQMPKCVLVRTLLQNAVSKSRDRSQHATTHDDE